MGNMMSGGIGIVTSLIGLAMAVVVFMGASKMKNLQSYGFAMAATVIAMIPCIGPCCILGLPIGIWALVILLKPEVKGAFQG
jgi:predicted PurR-regulated permease PerM